MTRSVASGAREIETLIIGGGHAGLSVSYNLTQRGRKHLVLERTKIGSTWARRWDSFRLLTPNWSVRLPGYPLTGVDPDGFITRDEIVGHLEAYAASFASPVELGVEVTSVRRDSDGFFRVETSTGLIHALNVVVATGAYPIANIPDCATRVPPTIVQLHCVDYTNPEALPAGAVLVVGSAQSGYQIARELRRTGRDVILALGACGWSPRQYRGRDLHAWLESLGFLDHTVDKLGSLKERFACTPNIVNRKQDFATFRDLQREGIDFVGRVLDVVDGSLHTSDDVEEILVRADRVCVQVRSVIDRYIAEAKIDAPEEPAFPAGPPTRKLPTAIALEERGIRSIVWTTGFRYDFSWIHEADLDPAGYPVHARGVTAVPGLYFAGLPWLHKRKSPLLLGAAEDAAYLVEHLAALTRSTAGV